MQADESGSFGTFLTDGCVCCRKGAKMVLFVTGCCPRDCFFCPLSVERKNRDVIFANERPVLSDRDVIEEAHSMAAEGTGITGGEPLLELERTIHYIRLLKSEFGEKHHIHLYTSTAPQASDLKKLADAGLDEIRFHPPTELWEKLKGSAFEEALFAARKAGICAGIEIPALEGADSVAAYAAKNGFFLNLNELEFSDTNAEALKKRGCTLKDDESNTVLGSAQIAQKAFDGCAGEKNARIHFCSSRYKDAVQLRLRLLRTARQTARPFDEITEDGTIIYGRIRSEAHLTESVVAFLKANELPEESYAVAESGDIIETAVGIVEELAILFNEEKPTFGNIQLWVIEQYPLENGFVVGSERLY